MITRRKRRQFKSELISLLTFCFPPLKILDKFPIGGIFQATRADGEARDPKDRQAREQGDRLDKWHTHIFLEKDIGSALNTNIICRPLPWERAS